MKKLHQQIEAMRLAKAQNELYDANRFNPFQFMQTDENGLSRILAFLLDSNEAHGQRDLFIRSFLQYLRLPKFLAYEKIIVTIEKPIKNSTKRRHDIFLEAWIGNELVWVMSIENKLRGASDQANQINDYWEDLGCYPTKNQHIVYLPVQIEQPSRESIKKSNWQNLQSNKQASIFSARDVVKWLEQTPIVAPSVQSFINQFKKFIQEDIMNLPSNSNELVTHIINDQDMLAAAITAFDNEWEIYNQLLQKLDMQLQKLWKDNFFSLIQRGWQYKRGENFTNRYLFIGFDAPETERYGIGIEFDSSWFQNAYYGVWAHKEHIADNEYQKLHNKFSDFINSNKQSKHWLGWAWLGSNLCNWNADTWLQVSTGQLANQIFDKLKPLLEIVQNEK